MPLRSAETAGRYFLSFVLEGARGGAGRFERKPQARSQRVSNYFRNDIYPKLRSQYNLAARVPCRLCSRGNSLSTAAQFQFRRADDEFI
jgi:hypothetical protein